MAEETLPPLEMKKRDVMASVSFSGFPVRSLIRHVGRRGGGEWILAYQAQQKKRLRVTLTSAIKDHGILLGESARITAPENTPLHTSAIHRCTLDKKLLLKTGFVNEPSELCVCNISGQELKSFNDHHFSMFNNLVSISASDNLLLLEAFERFPVLEELELSLNSITHINIGLETFSALQTLDLSYNHLSERAIITLGKIPNLKELHLTGNNIISLPSKMCRPQPIHSNTDSNPELRMNFPRLEKLWLDDNKLSHASTFAVLAGLRKLKYLNLDNNELHSIPRLKLLGTSSLKNPPHQSPLVEDNSHIQTESFTSQTSINVTDSTPVDHTRDINSTSVSSRDIINTSAVTRDINTPSLAPFPELYSLSIVNNMILDSNCLLACGTWPALKQLIIIGNPLVSMNKGLPTILEQELVKTCGISIIRCKLITEKKCNIWKKAKEFKKISTTPPPTIPKKPIFLALEAPPSISDISSVDHSEFSEMESISEGSTLSSQTSDNRNEADEIGDEQTNGPAIFMTQPIPEDHEMEEVNDVESVKQSSDEDTPHVDCMRQEMKSIDIYEEFHRRRTQEIERFKHIPDKYKGFESLLNTEGDSDDDSPPLPTNPHSCARVLKYALKNQLMLTNAKKSSSSTSVPTGEYLKKSPSAHQYDITPAISTREKEVQLLLQSMKTHEMSVEMNLEGLISQKKYMKSLTDSNKKRNETPSSLCVSENDGRKLFSELESKYDQVRETSLETLAAVETVREMGHNRSSN